MMSTEEIRKNLMKEMKDLIKEEDNMNIEKVFKCVMDLKNIFDELKKGGVEVYFYQDHIEFCKDEFCLEYYFIDEVEE